jgi:predicted NBD/HSP70 family sugar kinase
VNLTSRSNSGRDLDIVVDLGASHFKIGSTAHDPDKPRLIRATPKDTAGIVAAVCEGVQEVASRYGQRIGAVSVGCPGLVTASGAVYKSLHISLSGCHLQAELERKLGVFVRVLNDAKAQALGHPWASSSLLYVVLGTGVGGAFVDQGKLVSGAQNFAGEIGHIPLSCSGRRCPCGQTDCLDTIASGWALSAKLGSGWYKRELLAAEEDAVVQAGTNVGTAAALCAILLNPAATVIAGHITGNAQFREGFLHGWARRGWAETKLEFMEDTWPIAFRGLAGTISQSLG